MLSGRRIQYIIFHLQDGAVAVKTSGCALKVTVHAFIQPEILLPHNLAGVGMLALAVLLGFVWKSVPW
jgi:hypothetical protein